MSINTRENTSFLVESGVMIALATIASYIKIYSLPQGGSVTGASLIPIFLIGFKYGLERGILVGVIYGILQGILNPIMVHPLQVLLDYPIAFGILGIVGIYKNITIEDTRKETIWIIILILIALLGRTLAHTISGVIFFREYADIQNVWLYSFIYNGSFLFLEFIIAATVMPIVMKRVSSFGRRL